MELEYIYIQYYFNNISVTKKIMFFNNLLSNYTSIHFTYNIFYVHVKYSISYTNL